MPSRKVILSCTVIYLYSSCKAACDIRLCSRRTRTLLKLLPRVLLKVQCGYKTGIQVCSPAFAEAEPCDSLKAASCGSCWLPEKMHSEK